MFSLCCGTVFLVLSPVGEVGELLVRLEFDEFELLLHAGGGHVPLHDLRDGLLTLTVLLLGLTSESHINPMDPNPAISACVVFPQSGHIRPEKRPFFRNFPK